MSEVNSVFQPAMCTPRATTASFQLDGPLVVYQLNHTCSAEIHHRLMALQLGVPVYCIPFLAHLDRMRRWLERQGKPAAESSVVLKEPLRIRQLIDESPDQPWHFLTVVRDPVAALVSRFFGRLDHTVPQIRRQLQTGSTTVEDLAQMCLRKWDYRTVTEWFDRQLADALDIDVYSRYFPFEKGYDVFRDGRFSVLVLRGEDLERCGAAAFREFLGLQGFQAGPIEPAFGTWYEKYYRQFLAKVVIPDERLEEVYNSRFARQFYTTEELDRFRARWTRAKQVCQLTQPVPQPRQPIDGPVFVYQMGKVGSLSVYHSLAAQPLGVPVYHAHLLEDLDTIAEKLQKQFPNPVDSLKVTRKGKRLRARLDADPQQHWNLVTLVRDPIARNVSRFFHTIEEVVPDIRQQLESRALDVDDLREVFLQQWEHDSALQWFDLQFKSVFDIDVFSHPFPHHRGYDILHKGRFSLLLLRLEDLDRCGSQALDEFLGIAGLRLQRTNTSAEAWYAEVYRNFLSRVSLPESYLNRMYESRFSRHFYTPTELDGFRAKWTTHTTMRQPAPIPAPGWAI